MLAEFAKSLPALTIAMTTLAATWLVGHRVASHWEERKKWRELELAALSEFYLLYGEFFEIWKTWSFWGPGKASYRPRTFARKPTPDETAAAQVELLGRSSRAEGRLEALLVKLVTERPLTERDVVVLACFRQAYQSLRESIRAGELLTSIDMSGRRPEDVQWLGSGSRPYRAFKQLAVEVAAILVPRRRARVDAAAAGHRLMSITDNRFETTWLATAETLLRERAPAAR